MLTWYWWWYGSVTCFVDTVACTTISFLCCYWNSINTFISRQTKPPFLPFTLYPTHLFTAQRRLHIFFSFMCIDTSLRVQFTLCYVIIQMSWISNISFYTTALCLYPTHIFSSTLTQGVVNYRNLFTSCYQGITANVYGALVCFNVYGWWLLCQQCV